MKVDYHIYKPLRNMIRKYEAESIILQCINKLHEISKKPIYEETGYMPWEILLLVKFTALDGSIGVGVNADPNTLRRLLNKIKYNIGNSIKYLNPGDSSGMNKFMRRNAFQQFGYQSELSKADIGRQIYLFNNLSWNYPVGEKFKEVTGVSFEDFFEISFACWSILGQEKRIQAYIEKNMLSSVSQIYGDEVLDKYLNTLSLDFYGLKKFIAADYEKCGDIEQQFYEQTPLKTFPLLKVDKRYYCYYPYVFKEKIKNCLYDTLKANDPQNFSNEFGYKFEEYISACLSCIDDKVIQERELKKLFPKSKIVDFVLPYEDCTVLMEVKAIELSPEARVNPTNLVLSSSLETSIVKSFKQVYSFAKTLMSNADAVTDIKSSEYFALIVTYKELYLGRGSEVWDEFIYEAVKIFMAQKDIDPSILPQTNIFFVSVEAFEKLIGVLATGKYTLPEILRQAVADDANPQTRKFLFDMHFKKNEYDLVPFVKEIADKYMDSVMSKHSDVS